jgi:predicted nucleotidyltransferase
MTGRKTGRKVIPKQTVIKKLQEAIPDLKAKIPVDAVYLFGSYANGKPKPYSDVDIAVISPAFGQDIVAEGAMLMEIFEKTGLMVEPRAYSREEYQKVREGTFLYEEVLRKGIRLTEKKMEVK